MGNGPWVDFEISKGVILKISHSLGEGKFQSISRCILNTVVFETASKASAMTQIKCFPTSYDELSSKCVVVRCLHLNFHPLKRHHNM